VIAKHANYPVNCEIRVIDFGGSTFDGDYHSSVINTRQYRAPEVILGSAQVELGWDSSSDLWSLGCILVELYTGELLFPTHKDSEHLAMMRKVLGRFPTWMGKNASRRFQKYFDRDYRLDFPYAFSESTEKIVNKLPYLEVEDS
jgi:dual-specificity kinase